jgi:lactaldehyde dehydrogenase / glycolaldehyde dehydrogenase
MRACNEISFGETYVDRENLEATQAFHSVWRNSGIGGADGKHGLGGVLGQPRRHIGRSLAAA